MWHAQFSKREFLELCLGGFDRFKFHAERCSAIVPGRGSEKPIDVYWSQDPSERLALPSLVVLPNEDLSEFLSALHASPQGLTPFTALCKVMNRDEANAYFSSSELNVKVDVLPAMVALCMVEAVVHSDGRLNLKQVSPAACRRTMSFAWGKAITSSIPASALTMLPSRWLDAYSMINPGGLLEAVHNTVSAALPILSICAELGSGLPSTSAAGVLAAAILAGNKNEQESAWLKLSEGTTDTITLMALAQLSREERGSYLQQVLRRLSTAGRNDSSVPVCAFLATQVAPGSLDHMDILQATGHPSLVFWYALFAALQAPSSIMAGQGGLGYRVGRDIADIEEQMGSPKADVSYQELIAVWRLGVESLSRKFGHTGEVEVEIVPLVTSSFTYHSRGSKGQPRPEINDYQLPLKPITASTNLNLSSKTRIKELLSEVIAMVSTLPDEGIANKPAVSREKSRKKNANI